MHKFAQWLINSTYFKKWAGIIGAYAAGVLTMMLYWKEVLATLEVWEIEKSDMVQFLLAVVAASGIVSSFGLSILKTRQTKRNEAAKVTP
jgi:hypothetical protein